MIATKLPSVLQRSRASNSISMERALNQIHSLLCAHVPDAHKDPSLYDRFMASIDDVETMLSAIER